MRKGINLLMGLFLCIITLSGQPVSKNHTAYENGRLISIRNVTQETCFQPLTEINLNVNGSGVITVSDSYGNEYFTTSTSGGAVIFKVGGALGGQMILLKNKNGKVLDQANIQVNCKTEINDEKGEFHNILNMLKNSMRMDQSYGHYKFNDKAYFTYDGWFQDNVHTFKGLKYFEPNVKDYVDLFADGQKEDGMIYDNYYSNYNEYQSWLDRFGSEFVKQGDPKMNSSFWCRIPIENEPEYSFLEAVYYVWKASGDDAWMRKRVENCKKAINYTRTNPYRWSDKFQLTKRAYTIDVWDFQCTEDASLYRLDDIMKAKLGVTRYGISYADNIGMAVGVQYLSEMLAYLGEKEESAKYHEMSVEWRKRTDEVCWNGHFYRHWVPEDPSIKRDFGGTDETKQVSLSNSYCLNRRMPHDKAVEVIKTYQDIRKKMPKSSPGEWYLLYPPYEKGWHVSKWEYMNGGVSPIVAGELAHGAYENGYETYASDILRRIGALADRSNGFLYDTYKGALPEKPSRNFTSIDLKSAANADFKGDENTPGVNAWTKEDPAINDMINFPVGKQVFHDIPFEIIDPALNGRKSCLILSASKEYPKSKVVNINAKAKSIYLVHAKTGYNFAAFLKINYKDGTSFKKNILEGHQVAGWWYPNDFEECKVAWKGPNRFCECVGLYLWGYNNPNPDKEIKSIEFVNDNEESKWMISGLTLSDNDVWFDPGIVSYGIPANWADAAVVYVLVEGLAGVKDVGVAFNKVLFAPRWESAGIRAASANIKYEASNGYLSYKYSFNAEQNQLHISFTGNGIETLVELYIPQGKIVENIQLNGKPVNFQLKTVEASSYATFTANGVCVNEVVMKLK